MQFIYNNKIYDSIDMIADDYCLSVNNCNCCNLKNIGCSDKNLNDNLDAVCKIIDVRKVSKGMKAMLSQSMNGKTDEEIIATREKAIKALADAGYEIVNTLFIDEWYSKEKMTERGVVQIPLCFLAKSLENMSLCHAAYFCKGWENARGCKIEHDAAVAYGLTIIYEE